MWLAGLGLRTSSSVCDVGSGNGVHLVWMRRQGFSRLEGFDPFIEEDIQVDGEIPVRRLALDQLRGGWDLIMLNHSFEHMPRPAEALELLRGLLNVGGSIVIRVPVADSWAWRTYGTDWVQLDAPRHVFLHTRRSIEILSERAGLKVTRVFSDSYAFQFWGSEQYRRGVPLRDPRSYGEDPATDLFTAAEIAEFERHSVKLNREAAGDSAGFVLRAI
jgi:SAM-dependent methyltransferase